MRGSFEVSLKILFKYAYTKLDTHVVLVVNGKYRSSCVNTVLV